MSTEQIPEKFSGWLGHEPEAAKGKMVWGEFEPKTWEETDVDIKISHCGICGSDIHMLSSGWGPTPYPCCVGHEIVGKAVRVGKEVKNIKVGDRVGVGAQAQSCLECVDCKNGNMTYCKKAVNTYGSVYPNGKDKSYGGYSNYNRTHGAFVVKIPEKIESADAAPMLCGGVTVYSPLVQNGCGPGKTVGIVGVGGLGHLAIQFATKMGCDVVVFSGTDSKKEEAKRLGASEFYATKGVKELKDVKPINRLLVTTSAQIDWSVYLPVMAPGGTIFPLSVDEGDFKIPYMGMLAQGLTVQGSIVAPRFVHKRMLEFAAHHQIKPITQHYDMSVEGIEKAMKDLDEGNVRYRAVLFNKN